MAASTLMTSTLVSSDNGDGLHLSVDGVGADTFDHCSTQAASP
jgi:hypothetical protein